MVAIMQINRHPLNWRFMLIHSGFLFVAILTWQVKGAPANDAPLDSALVARKIQMFALRDDTLPANEQPAVWLQQRLSQVTPQLIAGLANTNLLVASNCLGLLKNAPGEKSLIDALLSIARNPDHAMSPAASYALRRFAKEPRVVPILEAAMQDGRRFPDIRQRADMAVTLGKLPQAAELLASGLTNRSGYAEYQLVELVHRLGDLAHPAAIVPLQQASQNHVWRLAAEAHLALAKLEPKGHSLTPAQTEFLQKAGRGGKTTSEFAREREKQLAALPQKEIRPFVLQMLESDDANDALGILMQWKDRAALPEIQRRLPQARAWEARVLIPAYLAIDETDGPITYLIERIKRSTYDYEQEQFALYIAQADLDLPRKLAALRKLHEAVGDKRPALVPRAIRAAGKEAAPMMQVLVENENRLVVFGALLQPRYRDNESVPAPVMSRALELLAKATPTELQNPETIGAAVNILDRAIMQKTPDAARLGNQWMTTTNLDVQLSAAHLAAAQNGDRPQALAILGAALNGAQRGRAARALVELPCNTPAERAERENLALQLVGKPVEDYALRVLTTCAGEKTATNLTPLLDGEDVPRAVHVAWVLAQHPDQILAGRALRRVAVFAMFHHQGYQQGAGIDFNIAPELFFHQTTVRLNPGAYTEREPAKVQIPLTLMPPLQLDTAEQQFLERAYRHCLALRPTLRISGGWFSGPLDHPRLDKSYVPWLQVVARTNNCLAPLYVQGQKVAHFPERQLAARLVASLTGQPATYVGLAGEDLDSTQTPAKPYADQDLLIARFVLDLLQSGNFSKRPESDVQWSRQSDYDLVVRIMTSAEEGFGKELATTLLAESQRRNMAPALKQAGFNLWQKIVP